MGFEMILKATRANFLPASIMPFLIGTSYVLNRGFAISKLRFFLGFFAVTSAHLAGNLLNDYFDYRSGADNIDIRKSLFFGGSKAIQEKTCSPAQILFFSLFFLFLCLFCSVAISIITGNFMFLLIMLICGILMIEYTAPPLRLSYNRLGEIDIFFLFGVCLVTGSFYLYTETVTFNSVLISLPISFLILSVIICNEIPDFYSDAKVKKNNLISISGREKGYIIYVLSILLSFLSIVVNILLGNLHIIAAASFLIYLIGIKAVFILRKLDSFESLILASKITIMLHFFVGMFNIFLLLIT